MKKTYLSPLCEIFQMNAVGHLLTGSEPVTEMEMPDGELYDDPDPMNPNHPLDEEEEEKEEEWGY